MLKDEVVTCINSRLETQSGPPDDDGRESDGGVEVACELVVACRDAAPVFEAAKGALDCVAPLVGTAVEGVVLFARRIARDDRSRSALAQELAQGVAVIGGIGSAGSSWRELVEEAFCGTNIAALAGRHLNRDDPSEGIANRMDLGRASAAGATDRLRFRPPLRPLPSDAPWLSLNRSYEIHRPRPHAAPRTCGARWRRATSGSSDCKAWCAAIFGRTIAPAAATLQDMNDAAQYAAAVNAPRARLVGRQMRFDRCPLGVTQPETLRHDPSSAVPEFESTVRRNIKVLNGFGA